MFGLAALVVRKEHYTFSMDSVAAFQAGLDAALETEDLARIAYAQFGLGFCLLWAGVPDRAEASLFLSLNQAEEAGVAFTQVLVLTYLSCLYRMLGDVVKARRFIERSLVASEQVDMPTYHAAAYANLAWLAWRAGQLHEAKTEAEQALATWEEYPYPFRWLAMWVLLAIHTKREELAEAVESAQSILHPSQRRQPGDLSVVLTTAVRAWQAGASDAARVALHQAVELAQMEGYL
ncbi:MAG: tetratricopeptide repeat protein [Halieaceae bacterium]|nr:tetratricopeptide repeat protein [Halieaceae bacterium]